MELFKQVMELLLLFYNLGSKNIFSKLFSIFTNEMDISFRNRKFNYLNPVNYYFNLCDKEGLSLLKTFFYKFHKVDKENLLDQPYSASNFVVNYPG